MGATSRRPKVLDRPFLPLTSFLHLLELSIQTLLLGGLEFVLGAQVRNLRLHSKLCKTRFEHRLPQGRRRRIKRMGNEHVTATIAEELCLPLKNTVLKINGRKKLGKTSSGTLYGGADNRPSTIRIGRAGMRVKYDEDIAR